MVHVKAVGYIRKSRTEGEQGFGIAAQRAAIEEWAKAGRHELVGVLVDNGVNGETPVATPS